MERLFIISMVLLPILAGTVYGPPIVWPADSAWKPLLQNNGDYYWDPINDENPDKIDIVGDTTTYPGAYWLYDNRGTPAIIADDQLLFRVRLNDQPANASNYVWSMIIDTDQDGLIEWGLQIDGKNDDAVELAPALSGGLTIGQVELDTVAAWSGSLADYSRFGAAPSTFDGNADGFADFGIDWVTFASLTGVNTSTPLGFSPLSSTTDQLINKDIPLGLDGSDPVGSIISGYLPAVPEPTTLILFAAVFGGSLLRRKRQPREL